MEEQLETEPKRLEGAPAEDGDRKPTRRLSLQFGFMVLQWIVLLTCLVFVGLCYFKSPGPQAQWIFIKNSNQSIICKKAIGMKKKDGTMDVNDLKCSVPIHCDGFYLVFLEGIIRLKGAKDSLTLGVYHRPGEKFLTIPSHGQKTEVKEVLVHEFRSEDEIYLEYNDSNYDTFKQDLTLTLIMLTPPSYCYSNM